MELLAPAKNIEVARAAIMAGADAVYIGAPRFGARQAAGNSIEDIRQLTGYAHRFSVKVLVTVNTLMDDNERREAAQMAWQLYDAGVDALIVQDLRLLKEDLPPIRLHASTQCDNRTPEQVVQLQRAGFRRAVLARELTIDQIRAIRKATLADNPDQPIELEVFVHGAVCVCYSGKCFMSERLLGRSANRGACAQMCRMAYDVLDSHGQELRDDQGKPLHQRYVLSLKDMDRSAYLRELIDAGVSTIKIEGRLKDADYVTNIVAYYRQKLDALNNCNRHSITHEFAPNPEKTFHRDGSPYFLHGRTDSMANWTTPKSTGEKIGIVTSSRDRTIHIQLLPGVTLHNGDGLCYGDKGFQVNSVTPLSGSAVAVSTFHKENVPTGTMIYRNTDTTFLKQLHAHRRIPVTLSLAMISEGFSLTISSNDNTWHVTRTFVHPHTLATQGITNSIVNVRDLKAVEAAIQPNTKVIYAETFGNPNSDVTDIDALAEIAHRHHIPLIIDNTFGTPFLIRPIEHGADVVVHSATKFIGGHGTSLGGVIVDGGTFDWKANADKFPSLAKPDPSYHGAVFADVAGAAAFVTRIRAVILRDTGATLSPFNAFILLQGLETLSLRVERHVENALKVINFLAGHSKVARINHPSLSSHPDHALYQKYFPKGAGSIFTFPATVRLSIGTEHIDDILDDLKQAFDKL